METVYSLEQIKEAWGLYRGQKVLKVLKDGNWKVHRNLKTKPLDATKAEVVNIHTVMSFPKFLEKEYHG